MAPALNLFAQSMSNFPWLCHMTPCRLKKLSQKLNFILFYIKEIRVTFEFSSILRDGSNIYSFSNKQRAFTTYAAGKLLEPPLVDLCWKNSNVTRILVKI